MSTALDICASAYRLANLDQTLTSFSTTQEFPYNCALDLLNGVLSEMNRLGSYWFTKTATALPYTEGVYQYDLGTLAIDPQRIDRVRRTASNYQGDLTQMHWMAFQRHYRSSSLQTTLPTRFSKYNDTLELNTIPDQDYSLVVYHFKDMPLVTTTTDTLLVPENDEDVVRDGVLAYLYQRMGYPAFDSAYQLWLGKVNKLLGDQKEDAGLPRQMPAAF